MESTPSIHESAAALLVDGALVAAAEEERFNRIKHGKQANLDNPHHFPEHAIRFCLDYAGLRVADIDHVAYSFNLRMRRAQFRAEWWLDPRREEVFLLRLGEVRGVAERILGRSLRQRLHFVPHHLAHAASAYFASGFDRAAILTVDGIGEAACSTLARADGTRIRMLETFDYPHSLGFVWEEISGHLGFSPYDASKVMGLAAYGDPEVFRRPFQSILRISQEDYAVDPKTILLAAEADTLETLVGPPCYAHEPILPRHADVAAALQEATNAAVTALVRRLKRKVPLDNLCIAGGVALNCVTNELIQKKSDFSNVFIPCAPHDAGTAVGAALVVHCVKNGKPTPSAATQRRFSVPRSTDTKL